MNQGISFSGVLQMFCSEFKSFGSTLLARRGDGGSTQSTQSTATSSMSMSSTASSSSTSTSGNGGSELALAQHRLAALSKPSTYFDIVDSRLAPSIEWDASR